MPRSITTLKSMGKDLAWTILQQARGIPDPKAVDDYLTDRTFVAFFARPDISERLCITAAIRQMNGHVMYMGPEERWNEAVNRYPAAMLGSMSYYMDAVIVHGMLVTQWRPEKEVTFPVINGGGPDAHPAHTLADIMCMLRHRRDDLRNTRIAWIGYPSGVMFSLMSGSKFFPYSMALALPSDLNRQPLQMMISELKTDITIVDTPQEAVRGSQFIFGGSSDNMDFNEMQRWRIDMKLLSMAGPDAYVLAGANPMNCIPMDEDLQDSRRQLFLQQSENRLRVYKRMLHWICEL